MTTGKPRVISFLSGKGGSGKTTVTISLAKLLADLGHPTLLVDLDLSTHGASYFFRNRLPETSVGLWEFLAQGVPRAGTEGVGGLPARVGERLYFVPSRGRLNVKGQSYESLPHESTRLRRDVMDPLIEWAAGKGIHYILIDLQAGYTTPSVAAAEVSDLAIFVTEADAISSDATDTLLIQLGERLPAERRYLVNKIDVRDADTYHSMRNVFQALNRLPPLPFDFGVRNAFGARQIPVNLEEPSPLLFALLETAKYIVPEIYEDLEAYKKRHADALFEKYDTHLSDLVQQREKLQRIRAMDTVRRFTRSRRRQLAATLAGVLMIALGLAAWLLPSWGFYWIRGGPAQSAFLVGVALVAGVAAWNMRLGRVRLSAHNVAPVESSVDGQLRTVEQDLDRYRSMLWTRSREFLIDKEVADRLDATNQEPTSRVEKRPPPGSQEALPVRRRL